MKNFNYASRSLAILLFASVFALGEYLVVAPKPAFAAGSRVTICHRTKSATNPYRLITISNAALNGHGNVSHSGPVFGTDATSDGNGETWGDIIPTDTAGDGLQYWTGSPTFSNKDKNWDTAGKSFFNGANASKCVRMTASRFVQISRDAGVSDADIAADLNDQDANEDSLLGTFTAGALDAQVGAISVTTNSATGIGAASATLNGTISNSTGGSITPKFQYGESSTLDTLTGGGEPSGGSASSASTITAVASLSGLTTGTTYYYRVIGESGTEDTLGTYYGEILSFTTGDSRSLTIDVGSYTSTYSFSATPPTITSTANLGDVSGTKSYSSSTTGVCTVDSSTGVVTFVGSGTCTIAAAITSGGGFASANASAISFTITATSRTLTINSGSYSGSYILSATPPTITSSTNNSTDGSGAKSYSSSTTSVCTINASTGVVAFVAAGTCTIAATIAANGANSSATASSISFTVSSNPTATAAPATPTTTAAPATPTTTAAPATPTTTVSRNSNVVSTGRRISICHRTFSATNPYVLITVDRNSLNGHSDHDGDIIPALSDGCPTSLASPVAPTTTVAAGRISICHANANGTYSQITVARSSLNGHTDHLDDIIAAPSEGCPYSVRQYALQSVKSSSTTSVPNLVDRSKVSICHATAAGFFVEITVDRSGLNGHDDHEYDLVPVPVSGCPTGVTKQTSRVTSTTVPSGKITICHATAAGFYVEITVDRSGLNGHDDHEGDLVPVPVSGCPGRLSALSTPTSTTVVPIGKIGVCHANENGSLEYLLVDATTLDGHGKHKQDLVPAPASGCSSPSSTFSPPTTVACINARELANFDESDSALTDGVKVSATQSPTDEQAGTIKISNIGSDPALTLVGVESVDPNVTVSVKSSGADYNKSITWVNEGFGTYCWKIEPFGDRDYIYTLPNPPTPPESRYVGLAYSTVIVKAGSLTTTDPNYQVNSLFYSPTPGTGVFADVNKNGVSDPGGQGGGTLGDKAISHVVLCVGSQSTVAQAPATTLPTSSSVAVLQTTTTTINWSADFCPEPITTTTTIPTSSSTTTSSTTSTTIAGESSTTTTTSVVGSSTSTTQPGGTGDPNPPIEILVKSLRVPESGKADLVLTLSDGVKSEVVFLKLNVKNFSIATDSLPATGQERWNTQQQLGWLMIVVGLLLSAIEFRRRVILRR